MNNDIPLSGSLKAFSFPRILAYLNSQRKTGILTFTKESVRKTIYLKEGDVVFAASNQDDEHLGDILLKKGKITPEQFDKSVESIKKTGRRQGAILVELGYISPKDLFNEVRQQVEEIVMSIFLWDNGTYSFHDASPPKETITLSSSMEEIILKGTGRKEGMDKEKEGGLLYKINELYGKIDELTYYDIFELDMNSTSAEIKKAYLKKAKEYHPDRHIDQPDPFVKDKLATLFTFLNKAYNTLINEGGRKDYDNVLLQKKHEKKEESDVVRAEEQFKRGLADIQRGNYWGAVDFLRWAIRLDPHQSRYWAHLSLALSNMPRRHKEAEENMLKAIELEPQNPNYYIHLGKIYADSGLKSRAVQQLKTALNWDPENKTALKELEKLEKERR